MKEIYVKYNPFTINTEIKVDGETISNKNSFFNRGERLQEWIDKLIGKLDEELNNEGGDYSIKFEGTENDYDDLEETVSTIKDRKIELKYIETKKIKDIEKEIFKIYEEIENSNYKLEELKSKEFKDRFQKLFSNEFEVAIVATMSSGKSTLINSLLGKKILPSKNEACTATITEIRKNDKDFFIGEAYSKDDELLDTTNSEILTEDKMKDWNSNKDVSTIKIEGDIPFVESKELGLVLIDTPGPNNSNDSSHKERLEQMLVENGSYQSLIIYILNATQIATNDDSELLQNIIAKLTDKDTNKITKDRFLFVVNKLDDFRKEDSVEGTLKNVKEYLENKGVENPNIYPTSALVALLIRDKTIEDEGNEKKYKINKLNKKEEYHFEKYAPLLPKANEKIEEHLKESKERNDEEEQALVHSGILSLEKAINVYLEKYAKPIKIKNIVEQLGSRLKNEIEIRKEDSKILNKTSEEKKELSKKIEKIESELEKMKNSHNFDSNLEEKIDKIKKEVKLEIEKNEEKIKNKIDIYKNELKNNKIKTEEGEKISKDLVEFGQKIGFDLRNGLQKIIDFSLKKSLNELYSQYIQNLKNIKIDDLNINRDSDLKINPFEIIEDSLESFKSFDEFRMEKGNTEVKEEITGTRWIKNPYKKLCRPWTWFYPSKIEVSVYENVEYIKVDKLLATYIDPIETNIRLNIEATEKYTENEIDNVVAMFKDTKNKMDNLISDRLSKMNNLAKEIKNKEEVEKEINKKKEVVEYLKEKNEKLKEIINI